MNTSLALLGLNLKTKLYPSVEKVLIVDEPDKAKVLLLLLLRVLCLGCGVRFTSLTEFTVLHLLLPSEAGGPVQFGEEVEGDGAGVGEGEGGGPCGVWVTCGVRRLCDGL